MDDVGTSIARLKRGIEAKSLPMRPPCSLDTIESFETKHGVHLPEGYRRFLLEIGNGGTGPPFYGLMSLGEVPSDYYTDPVGALLHLDRPFPLERFWVWEGEKEANPELSKAIEHGRLIIGNDGCGQYWILVVSGPERGQVWQRTEVGLQPCAPRRDFLSWYEYWLGGGSDWWADFR